MDKKSMALLEAFRDGTCTEVYQLLGCRRFARRGSVGYLFRVWAPNALRVCVTGDFNSWNPEDLPMTHLGYGVWEAFSDRAYEGCPYKYAVTGADGVLRYKADPCGTRCTPLPETSSMICTEDAHQWSDGKWMRDATLRPVLNTPMNIYEVHLGSWHRRGDGSPMTYEELAGPLTEYMLEMGYTHVELLPLAEHSYDSPFGYGATGPYAPTFRYGTPVGLKRLIERLHKAGLGVILDWDPVHFPREAYSLGEFDGTCLYELEDEQGKPRPVFDYGKPEVRSFLVSNAVYWLQEFHVDGLRVGRVTEMLYPDGDSPNPRLNRYGGRENLEAIEFLRAVNHAAFKVRPNALMAAEETASFPMVTRPDFDGGLGFLFKWDTNWAEDTLSYFREDPVFRRYHHERLTFPMTYAFTENHVQPLSHRASQDASLMGRMPGEYDWKFANLRALYGYQFAHPGKKLSFMGGEFGQFAAWTPDRELDWNLLHYDRHLQLQSFVRDLNRFYLDHPQLWQNEDSWEGFQWIEPEAAEEDLLAFRRIDKRNRELLVICSFCPIAREGCRLGVPRRGVYRPVLCSDDPAYGGTGSSVRAVSAERVPFRDYKLSALFDVPPMSVTFYIRENQPKKEDTSDLSE